MVPGTLADVDDLDVGGEFVEHRGRAEPVDDHDVGFRDQPSPAHGDEVDRSRTAADEVHPPDRCGASAPHGQPALAQSFGDRVAQQARATGVDARVGDDADDAVARPGLGREPGGAVGAVTRVDAQDAAILAARGHLGVDVGVARRGVHEPCVIQSSVGCRARPPLETVLVHEPGRGRAELRRDHAHDRAIEQEAADAACRDLAAADHHDLPAGERDAHHRRHAPPFQRMNTSPASSIVTGQTVSVFGSLPCVSRHTPVRRSNTCLNIGDATVGAPSRVPTMPLRHHVGAAVRVALLHRVDAATVHEEQCNLLAVDERRPPAFELEVGHRAHPNPGRGGRVLLDGHPRTASVVPAMSTRPSSRSASVAGRACPRSSV